MQSEFQLSVSKSASLSNSTLEWNLGQSFPIKAGHPCLGCTERHFFDRMTPFYKRIPDIVVPGLGVEYSANVLGAAAVAAARFCSQYVGAWDREADFAAAYLRAAGMPEQLLDLIDLDAPISALLEGKDAPYRAVRLLDRVFVFSTSHARPCAARVLPAMTAA